LAQVAEVTVNPATFLRWYKRLVGQKYHGAANRSSSGRPAIKGENVALILRLAKENSGWGYRRIQGELRKLGIALAKSTVARVLADAGIDPAPKRTRGKSWTDFLQQHWQTLYAVDFFTVEVLRLFGTVRYHVAVVMEMATRRVHIGGIVPEPDEAWTMQMARNLTDDEEGFLKNASHLIHDRAPVFGKSFKTTLAATGVKTVKLPPHSPNLNAQVERFNRTIQEESLDHFVICSVRHLEHLVGEFVDHYNQERPHQGLDNVPIALQEPARGVKISKRSRLGGLLHHYYRTAA
jgi:transposase InsO family protein